MEQDRMSHITYRRSIVEALATRYLFSAPHVYELVIPGRGHIRIQIQSDWTTASISWINTSSGTVLYAAISLQGVNDTEPTTTVKLAQTIPASAPTYGSNVITHSVTTNCTSLYTVYFVVWKQCHYKDKLQQFMASIRYNSNLSQKLFAHSNK